MKREYVKEEKVLPAKPREDITAKVAMDAAKEAQRSAEAATKLAQTMIETMSNDALIKEMTRLITAQNRLIELIDKPQQALRVKPVGDRGNGLCEYYDIIPLQKKTH